jgi:uncharacterized membrane protein
MPHAMSNAKPTPRLYHIRRFRLRYIGQYFLRGILVIAPFLITAALLLWLFRKVDGLLSPVVTSPGLGLASVLLAVVLIGWVSSFFIVRRVFGVLGYGLERMPGVSFIYSSIRDFFEAFVGNKKRFTNSVLVNVLAEDVWMLGFLTDEELESFGLGAKFVSVYVPQAYNVAGQLYLVKRDRVKPIDHLSPPEVMRYAVSGGAVEMTDKEN